MENIIIISDSGGSKTDWSIISSAPMKNYMITTSGINPSIQADSQIEDVIKKLDNEVKRRDIITDSSNVKLYFFGSGCNSEETKCRLKNLISNVMSFSFEKLEFNSDLEGAAKALFGDEEGIACILGTGSASGFYNGSKVVNSIPSLGFILGDEGSGAAMGKDLLNSYFKHTLPYSVNEKLAAFSDMGLTNVIRKVYRDKNPNKYLASFVPFLKQNEEDSRISEIIDSNIKLFFNKNVLKYKDNFACRDLGLVGGVATVFSERIKNIATFYGYNIKYILDRPINLLSEYYERFL